MSCTSAANGPFSLPASFFLPENSPILIFVKRSFYVGLYVAFVEQLGDDGGWYICAACCQVELLFAVMLVFSSFFLIFSKGNAEGTNS